MKTTDIIFFCLFSSSAKSSNSLEKIMLNIQVGSREYNLPYALTKTIGEVGHQLLFVDVLATS